MSDHPDTVARAVRVFLRSEQGTTAIEYGLLASLIGLCILGTLSATGDSVGGMINLVFDKVATALAPGV